MRDNYFLCNPHCRSEKTNHDMHGANARCWQLTLKKSNDRFKEPKEQYKWLKWAAELEGRGADSRAEMAAVWEAGKCHDFCLCSGGNRHQRIFGSSWQEKLSNLNVAKIWSSPPQAPSVFRYCKGSWGSTDINGEYIWAKHGDAETGFMPLLWVRKMVLPDCSRLPSGRKGYSEC